MFNDVLDYIKGLQGSTNKSKAFLRKLRGARTRLVNRMTKAEQQVALMKNPDKYVKSLDDTLRSETIKAGKDVLQGSILEAIRDNYEFDWPEYKRGLLAAAKSKEIFTVRALGGTSWDTRYLVSIDMDDSAGRLNRWAAGVKAYRKQLELEKEQSAKKSKIRDKKGRFKKYKKPKYDPIAASYGWANIFEGRTAGDPRFRRTIAGRLEYSGATAPFWELLDKGEVSMSSDRGGFPTPSKQPTRFVAKASEVMEEYLKNLLQTYRNNYDSLFTDYDKFLEEAEKILLELESMIEQFSIDDAVLTRLEQKLAGENQKIDRNKLAEAVRKIEEGLLTKGSVELTARGSPRRVRRAVSTISDFLTDY